MIVVADVNTIWRRKPFDAVSDHCKVLGLEPQDFFKSLSRLWTRTKSYSVSGCISCVITLPPGWASRFTGWTARRIWSVANGVVMRNRQRLTALVVTSPHYLSLVERAQLSVPTFYYCSDDYSQYVGWGGESLLELESRLVNRVSHSFFVSDSLAQRAILDYGVTPDQVSVIPNATDDCFLQHVPDERIQAVLARYPGLRRPLVGVIGGINERLEIDLLLGCADQLDTGTLVMVGPVGRNLESPAWSRLKCHPNCAWVGPQPHEELPIWMQALDVALIPYRDTPLNRNCSPMRLYDHLAAGRPIVATAHCQQVNEFANVVDIAITPDDFLEMIQKSIALEPDPNAVAARKAAAKENLWSVRAERIADFIGRYSL